MGQNDNASTFAFAKMVHTLMIIWYGMINEVDVLIVGGSLSLSALRTRGLGPRKPKPSNHGPRSSNPDVTRAWRFEPRWLILFIF